MDQVYEILIHNVHEFQGIVNEMTGERVLRDDDVPDDVAATVIAPMGNYAVSIHWTDGHSSIYPYEVLRKLTA